MIVKRTGTSKSAKSEIRYIEAHKAHKNTNGITKRNLAVTGFNCRTDSRQHTYEDFKNQLNKTNHKIKTQNFVISSKKGDFDPNNPEDIYRFEQFAIGFTKRAFAKPTQTMEQTKKKKQPVKPVSADKLNTPHYPILIALQADNTREILHAHIIVGNANIYNHHALPSKYKDIYHLRRADDEEVRVYNNKFKDKKIYDLSKNYKRIPTPRQKSIANLLHQCMNDPKINNLTKVRKNFKQNGITFKVRRPRKISKYTNKSYRKSNKKHNYRSHRGVVFEITNGKIHKTNNDDKSTTTSKKDNKKTYIKLSSISWVYKQAYGTGINYGMIKHNLALKRMGKFKPIRNTKASSTKSKSKPVPASSVTSSASIKPTNQSAFNSELSNLTNAFTHTTHHHTPLFTESSTNAANANNSKPTKSIADNEPQMQYNYNQSSASSSESETDDTPVHIKFNYKDKQAKKWIKITWPVGNLKERTKKVGEDYWWWKPVNFKIPYFNSHHLETLIHQYENDGEEENKQALDNFQSKCDYDDKQAINTRLARDSSYYEAEASINDVKRDIHNLHMAQKRGFGFSR